MKKEVSMALLIKLGSIIVHEDERRTPGYSQPHDDAALQTLRNDPEVMEFMASMDKSALLPSRRDGMRYYE